MRCSHLFLQIECSRSNCRRCPKICDVHKERTTSPNKVDVKEKVSTILITFKVSHRAQSFQTPPLTLKINMSSTHDSCGLLPLKIENDRDLKPAFGPRKVDELLW